MSFAALLVAIAASFVPAIGPNDVQIVAPGIVRQAPLDTAETAALRTFAARAHAPGAAVDNAGALARFFVALDEADHDRVNVAFFGNSLIAVDRIVDVVRDRLVQVGGDGGRGFLLADRLADYGPRFRTARIASGWSVCTLGDVKALPASRGVPFGLHGVVHVAERSSARSLFSIRDDDDVATVFATFGPGRGGLRARFDDGAWQQITAPAISDDKRTVDVVQRLDVPVFSRSLELQATGARVIVHGVAVESEPEAGGVVVDTLGVPAIDATLWLGTDEHTFAAHVKARAPDLAVIMLGGNETKRLAWRRRDVDGIDADLRTFIRRIRAPTQSSCLVVGPIDAVVGGDGADPFRQRPQLAIVNEHFATVAHDEGCAYFDLYAAMGGRGSLQRFHELGALHDDLVHPKGRGLDVLGYLIAEALLTSWRENGGGLQQQQQKVSP